MDKLLLVEYNKDKQWLHRPSAESRPHKQMGGDTVQEWIGFAVVLALSAVGWLLYRIGLDRWGRELRRLEDWGHAPVECSRGTLRKKRSEEVDRAHPSRTKIIYQGYSAWRTENASY